VVNARRLLCVAAIFASSACASLVDVPARDRPFVYLLLSPAPVTRREDVADSMPWALVASTVTPIEARYRTVERFRLRRVADNASFVWTTIPMTGRAGNSYGIVIDGGANANVVLHAAGDSGALGWRSLSGGSTYALDVLSEGTSITGMATIPARPILQLTEQGTAHIVRWTRSAGAAGYFVETLGEEGAGRFSSDTAFRWCEREIFGSPAPRTLRVVALDQNAYWYFTDSTAAGIGLSGALGLFGGANEARLTLSGPPVPADDACYDTRP
jgi:hypothetical protein